MKALVIEHPKLMLAENKGFNKTLSKLYRASSDFLGNASLTVEQQSTLKTRSLCLPLVSDNPWKKGPQEADEILKVVLEDMGLQAAPANGAHDYHKFVNTTTQYERQIAYLRELLNHTFLRAIYHTSTRQARMEYKEVQEALLDKNARRQANAVEQFTAQHIIDYIETHCVTANDKTLVQLTNAFNDMIRHKGQTLLNWLQSFSPLMTRYRRAFGLNNALSDDDLKRLWKLHFAKQVNTAEHQVMLNFRKDHLTNQR
jgi:ribulose bisphosphate carboxylase small subunit